MAQTGDLNDVLWSMVKEILDAVKANSAQITAVEDSLANLQTQQNKQTVLLNQILVAVEPPPAARLVLTLGKSIPQ